MGRPIPPSTARDVEIDAVNAIRLMTRLANADSDFISWMQFRSLARVTADRNFIALGYSAPAQSSAPGPARSASAAEVGARAARPADTGTGTAARALKRLPLLSIEVGTVAARGLAAQAVGDIRCGLCFRPAGRCSVFKSVRTEPRAAAALPRTGP